MSDNPVQGGQFEETTAGSSDEAKDQQRDVLTNCQGVLPLAARLEPWMLRLCNNQKLAPLVNEYGSPLNVLNDRSFRRNIARLYQVAESQQLPFDLYFARKANKCLGFLDVVQELGCGVDTASEPELEQTLKKGVPGDKIVCTAAVKSAHLLDLCIENGVTIVIDNADELRIAAYIACQKNKEALIAVRVSEFEHQGTTLESRFGFAISVLRNHFHQLMNQEHVSECVRLTGVQFHLNGYCVEERVSALRELLPLIDHWRTEGHDIQFLDIGGGFPMSYLKSRQEWSIFWLEHSRALMGRRSVITYRNHGLGLMAVNDQIYGERNSYPYWQSPVQGEWFEQLLDSSCGLTTVAGAIKKRELELRCEPGRSLLDGCGMTIARVEYRKQRSNGDWMIGLAMNHTQCRTSNDDFLVDPLLVPSHPVQTGRGSFSNNPPMEGYLVGAYCTESELLALRKLKFSNGISVGDNIVFPNTAGYLMHFRESRSHQFPLAKNVFLNETQDTIQLDEIEQI
ncbi:Diaminopimelate decarboxylase [Polystyrenella longa]|uniref:Diaminopimelate decarboxylase n=1 Tax=Polystyrenella longa TaxID=2528007 RepID=A0A518CLE6_9PLAN|nr:Y4yA family PLP-dependent enzyme [Polystyrenella longa]QDU80047.1 Diaminopimelate decarboxylase [Polystyrenella longa]